MNKDNANAKALSKLKLVQQFTNTVIYIRGYESLKAPNLKVKGTFAFIFEIMKKRIRHSRFKFDQNMKF